VHPNELADGALTAGGLGGHGVKLHTWMHQNNAVVEHLVAGHGTRWDFGGIVLHRGHFYLYEDKQRVGLRIAESATLLGANGVVFTLGGAGNNVTEVMLAIQECERRGIKTVLITWEHAGPDGSDYPLPFAVPEAVAIVSTGNLDEPLALPKMDRVVGDDAIRVRPEIGGAPNVLCRCGQSRGVRSLGLRRVLTTRLGSRDGSSRCDTRSIDSEGR